MFSLINKNDSKVFSNSKFIKNADFFKDAIAFFDAFSLICEKDSNELPNYCVFNDGTFCLEGICLFFKFYATEFGFKTIDLSIDYLKTLYYAIASLSEDSKSVSREVLINEYLVYKDANAKYFNKLNKEYSKIEKEHLDNLAKFNNGNNKYAKYFMTARVLDILATIIIIFSFMFAIFPVSFYLAERLALKNAIVYSSAILLIGLILKIELKIFANYLSNLAMDEAYSLQVLKTNKNNSSKTYEDFKIKNSQIVCEFYNYNTDLCLLKNNNQLDFETILKLANKNNFKSFNLKNDVLKTDNYIQEEVYDVVDRILKINPEDIGRFENIYNEIKDKDYLKFNKLVRFNFIDKFVEYAKVTKRWKLDFQDVKVDPFDIDVKKLADEKIEFLQKNAEQSLSMNLLMFFETKFAKKTKGLQLKNIKDENSLYQTKVEYINHFANIDRNQNEESFKRNIPILIDLKLDIIKNRVVCNSLGESVFFKVKDVIYKYENSLEKDSLPSHAGDLINEKTEDNKNFVQTLFECDEIRDLGNGEVLCVVGEQSFKGFRLANI